VEIMVHYGLHLPLMGDYADPRVVVELAKDAEAAGWEGFFVWDHLAPSWHPYVGDPWVTLTAIAAATSRIRLGTLITPLPRRRPWLVARQTVALDHLSNGRVTLGVGLGGYEPEYASFGEPSDLATRAAKLDEGLDVLTGLWSGEPFTYHGRYYTVENQRFLPRPIQSPRIPIWIAATWPHKAPFRRAARWDGVYPTLDQTNFGQMQTAEIKAAAVAYVKSVRTSDAPFDVVHGGITSGTDAAADAAIVAPYAAAGVTWWLESINPDRWGGWAVWPREQMQQRVRLGPPAYQP
jgi:alkanesulfonate monooxygenase SsuD/methylene tetrahydromethanopterin reductase-like flavin-dependent oxidoreductase (luciferase family)